jgi:hypothetical protein
MHRVIKPMAIYFLARLFMETGTSLFIVVEEREKKEEEGENGCTFWRVLYFGRVPDVWALSARPIFQQCFGVTLVGTETCVSLLI